MKNFLVKHKTNLISHGVALVVYFLLLLVSNVAVTVTGAAFFHGLMGYFLGAALHRGIYKMAKQEIRK